MNRQTLIALLLAIAAALLTYYYLSEKESAIQSDATPIKVMVAGKPISRGMQLTSSLFEIVEIPGAFVVPGAIAAATKADVIKQWQEFKNQYALVPIAKGEQLLTNKLSKITPGFAETVPEGMRIISLALDASSALGGNIKPGNHVDILGTFEHKYQNTERKTTVMLAQNIVITAVGNETAASKPNPGKGAAVLEGDASMIVCMAVSPEDAVRLSLAEREGNLKLALRAMGDDNQLDLGDENLGSVLGPLMRVKKEEIQPAKKEIQIIRGLQ